MSNSTHPNEQTKSNNDRPTQTIRNGSSPIFADELAEIKFNSYTTKLVFGCHSPEDSNILNESVTIAIPTPHFMSALVHMMLPILKNEEALQSLVTDYQNFANQSQKQLNINQEADKK